MSDTKDNNEKWVERLEEWLPKGGDDRQKEIQNYATAFNEQDITTVERLALLKHGDLAALGVSVGHRPHILEHARAASAELDPPSTWALICGHFGLDFNVGGIVEELGSWKLWRGVFSEFFASGIFVFLLNAVIVASGLLELGYPNGRNNENLLTLDPLPSGRISTARYLSISIGAGLAFTLTNYTFFHSSGGHITPAISFSFLWTRKLNFLSWLLYLAAQLVGAIIGSGFVKTVHYQFFDLSHGGVNRVHSTLGYDDGVSVGVDTLTTFILCMTALSFFDEKRAKADNWFGHLALGFVFTTVHLIALPINGASMNPARSFATAAIFHEWDSQWTWWLGPYLGASIAAIWYELFIREKDIKAWRTQRPSH
jgi:aquaporin PIP